MGVIELRWLSAEQCVCEGALALLWKQTEASCSWALCLGMPSFEAWCLGCIWVSDLDLPVIIQWFTVMSKTYTGGSWQSDLKSGFSESRGAQREYSLHETWHMQNILGRNHVPSRLCIQICCLSSRMVNARKDSATPSLWPRYRHISIVAHNLRIHKFETKDGLVKPLLFCFVVFFKTDKWKF